MLNFFRPHNNERKEHQLGETAPNFHRVFKEGKSEFTASRGWKQHQGEKKLLWSEAAQHLWSNITG